MNRYTTLTENLPPVVCSPISSEAGWILCHGVSRTRDGGIFKALTHEQTRLAVLSALCVVAPRLGSPRDRTRAQAAARADDRYLLIRSAGSCLAARFRRPSAASAPLWKVPPKNVRHVAGRPRLTPG